MNSGGRVESWMGATALCLVCLVLPPAPDLHPTDDPVISISEYESPSAIADPDTTFHQEVSWSPDGSRLSISRLDIHLGYRSSIGVMNYDGSYYVELAGGTGDRWTTWSPDGDQIAFASSRDGHADIYVMTMSSSETTRVTSEPSNDTHPDWSSDGERIVFVSDRDGSSDIYVMSASGGDAARITGTDQQVWNPRWSPDGSRIAYYAAADAGEDSVYVVNADGSGQTTIDAGIWPSWSPDGARLLYTSDSNVYSMTLETRERSLVIEDAFFARWSPDGRRIAFIRTTWRATEGWPSTSDVFILNVEPQRETRITGR